MREIKFKAWDKKSKKMREIDTIYFHNTNSAFDYNSSNLPKRIALWFKDIINQKMYINYRDKEDFILLQYTSIKDKNSKEVYIDDLLKDEKGKVFRVYDFPGGPVIKAYAWAEDINELSVSDQLIVEPLADIQTQSYIKQSCEVIGNIYQTPIEEIK